MPDPKLETITLAGGCFWCTEAVFQKLKGVWKVTSGYANSQIKNPSYEQVASGETGAAEAIQIEFDPKVVSLETILEVFFKLHDPTTLNKQGADIGSEYRSGVFYQDSSQKELALKVKERIQEEKVYQDQIVTEIVPLENFFEAGEYHKDFYLNNQSAPYCRIVIDPKITKLYKLSQEENIKLK
jgi:peptide-methionine (S)-S-oxide reductase